MNLTAKDYIPVPLHEFVNGVQVQVDLYVRLSESKFVMVAKAGTQSNVEQFKNYQSHEVSYLWVRKNEYYKIAHQAIVLAGVALTRKELNDRQKTSVVTHAARGMFRQLEHLGVDLELYNNAKQVTEVVVAFADSHTTLADLFASLSGVSDQLLSHSVAVSTLSVMIGQALGYEKKQTLEKLALGGLLHDIGLKAIPGEISRKPLALMTPEEIQIYETHPFRGMQMLLSLGIVPDDIVSIVYEHHENSIGQGYPQRLRDLKMHPLAKIVALADAYAELIIANPNCPVAKNPREALMYIEHTLGTPFNRDAFRALKRIVDRQEKKSA